jgi:hypothetical protein
LHTLRSYWFQWYRSQDCSTSRSRVYSRTDKQTNRQTFTDIII